MRTDNARIGYVLKMYPRFSETFVVSEILAREAHGEDIEIFSLRAPVDPRFHAQLAYVQAPVRYVPRPRKTEDFWDITKASVPLFSQFPDVPPELLEASADDAIQAIWLAMAAKKSKITHFHAHFASVATTVARLASLLTGIPYSFTTHAKDIFHVSVDPDDLAGKIADAHHVVTISDYNFEHLASRFPEAVSRTTMHRIYNGLDLTSFPFRDYATRPVEDIPTVVSVGRLVEKKGLDVLVDAAALLKERGRQVKVLIIGGGVLAEALSSQVSELGLEDIVEMQGPQPQDVVRKQIADADVMAVPCVVGSDGNADGLPTVLLEAMALGTPCISTDVTGIGEAVRHEETGLRVAQHDAEGLADAICRILDDRETASEWARAARELVATEFDSVQQATSLEKARKGTFTRVFPSPDSVHADDSLHTSEPIRS